MSKLNRAVGDARKQFNGANTGLDRLAETTDHIAQTLQHAAMSAGRLGQARVPRLGGGSRGAAGALGSILGGGGSPYGGAPRPGGGPAPAPGGASVGADKAAGGAGGAFAAAASAALVVGAVKAGQAFAGAVGDVLENADAAANSRVFDPEAYQRLAAAAQFADTNIKEVEGATLKLRTELGKSKLNPELQKGLQALNISAKQLKGMSPEDQIGLISDRLRDFKDEGTRAIVAEKVFGTGEARNILPLLEQGSVAIREAGDEAERLGMVLDKDAIEAAASTKDALDQLGQRYEGFKTRTIGALLPVIADVSDGLVETFDRISGPLGEISSQVGGLLAPALESVIEIVSMLGEVAGDAIGPLADYWGPVLTEVFHGIEDIVYQVVDIFYELGEQLGVTGESAGSFAEYGDMAASALSWLFDQASMVLSVLGELAGIVLSVLGLVWDLGVAIEDTTGFFSGLVSVITGTVEGALNHVMWILDDISEMFDMFGSGKWIEGFKKLGGAILDFILEPLRMLVADIIWVADAISEDLVPDSVRAFANNTRAGAAAFAAGEESRDDRKTARQQREEARAARAAERDTQREINQRKKATEEIGQGEGKVSAKRMAALKQEGRKLSGPGLVSLGARDEKGRDVSVWLGQRLDTAAVARAANNLGISSPVASATRLAPHTPPALAQPGLSLQPLTRMAAAAAAATPGAVPVSIGEINIQVSGSTPREQLRDFAMQVREIARDEISTQVRAARESMNPGGLTA